MRWLSVQINTPTAFGRYGWQPIGENMQKRFWYDPSRKMVIGELITDFNVSLTGPIFDWFSASFDSPEQWKSYYERRERWNVERGYRIRRIVERTVRNGPRKAFIAVLNAFQDVTQEMEGIAGWEPWFYETANLTINAVLSERRPPSLVPVIMAVAAVA
jgi:hypothetical protein